MIAATIAELGTPTDDGVVGTIDVDPTVQREHMVWDLVNQVWIGRSRYSLRSVDEWGYIQGGSGWTYLSSGEPLADVDQNAYGFQPHHVPRPDLAYAAGLKLQECLTAEVYRGTSTVDPPLLALNWYELNEGEEFLSPVPANIGVNLQALPVWADQHWHWHTSGWQNSPVATPTKTKWYPLPYAHAQSPQSRFRRFTGRYRFVGGPGVGGLGGTDGSSKLPPVTDKLFSWHVADDITLANAAAISEWPDFSGWSRHLQQATSANQPTYRTNQLDGHAVVRFDGVNDFLLSSLAQTAQPYTIIVVLKQYSTGGTQQVWAADSDGGAPLFYRDTGTDKVNLWTGGTDITYNRGTAWPSGFICMTAVANGASSAIYEGKTQKVTGNPGASNMTGLVVGARSDGSLPAQIDVAEVIVYYKALSGTEINSVCDYIHAKYPSVSV